MHRDSVPPSSVGNMRIEVVDALRGSALGGIMLLHAIEHWNFMVYPEHSPAWLNALDQWTLRAGFLLFAGKAYAVFALLFGLSFFLILDRWSRRGIPVRSRFLWRLAVLGIFGYLHGLVFWGDFLLIIAILGVPLVILERCSNRTLAWLSALLVMQIPSLLEASRVLLDQGYHPTPPRNWSMDAHLVTVYSHGSFIEVVNANRWQGQLSRLWWFMEAGRSTQMLGLFLLGFILGRSRVLENPVRLCHMAKRALYYASASFVFAEAIKHSLHHFGWAHVSEELLIKVLSSYCGLAQAAIWASGIVLLFESRRISTALRLLAPCGRTSLTCYVMQGLIGVSLFYGFGMGLYRFLGPFYSMLLGAAFFIVQCVSATLWLNYFVYGPLEWLWRSCTLGTLAVPFVKTRRRNCYSVSAPGVAS